MIKVLCDVEGCATEVELVKHHFAHEPPAGWAVLEWTEPRVASPLMNVDDGLGSDVEETAIAAAAQQLGVSVDVVRTGWETAKGFGLHKTPMFASLSAPSYMPPIQRRMLICDKHTGELPKAKAHVLAQDDSFGELSGVHVGLFSNAAGAERAYRVHAAQSTIQRNVHVTTVE